MRTTNSTFKTEKNSLSNSPIFLYTIYDYNGSDDNLYFAQWDSDVIFDGVTYSAFPVKHEYVSENTQGQVDAISVTLGNVSRLIQTYLESYDWRGKKVSIKMVWANQLADPDAYIEDIYYIDTYTADQNSVEATLTSKFDVLDIGLPNRIYSRNYCGFKFKDADTCGYSGGESECNKTLQRCRELANNERFGGFPSIPTQRIYLR